MICMAMIVAGIACFALAVFVIDWYYKGTAEYRELERRECIREERERLLVEERERALREARCARMRERTPSLFSATGGGASCRSCSQTTPAPIGTGSGWRMSPGAGGSETTRILPFGY